MRLRTAIFSLAVIAAAPVPIVFGVAASAQEPTTTTVDPLDQDDPGTIVDCTVTADGEYLCENDGPAYPIPPVPAVTPVPTLPTFTG